MTARVCPSCEQGTLHGVATAGRTMKHRNLLGVPVPADLEIPTCDHCGAEVVNFQLAEKLDAVLEEQWQLELAKRAASDIARLQAARPLREWERLLGLSPGYLSKLRNGKGSGAPLTALLALLANNPNRAAELESAWGWPPGLSDSMLRRYTTVAAPSSPPPRPIKEVREQYTVQSFAGERTAA